jgi:hypothetical protein
LKMLKSINHKGAHALRNSPVGYFSVVARLQGWLFHKGHKVQNYRFLPLSTLCLFKPPKL